MRPTLIERISHTLSDANDARGPGEVTVRRSSDVQFRHATPLVCEPRSKLHRTGWDRRGPGRGGPAFPLRGGSYQNEMVSCGASRTRSIAWRPESFFS